MGAPFWHTLSCLGHAFSISKDFFGSISFCCCCCCCCCCCVASVVSDSVRPHRRQPTRLPRPWDSPGKNSGVGCHFLLQCMKVKSESEVAQLCPTLIDPMDCPSPGSSVHGILQARILEWIAMPFSRGSSQPRDRISISYVSCIGRQVLYHLSHQRSPSIIRAAAAAKSRQSCPTLCDPIDGSPPDPSVHGIFQARVLEWVAIAFSLSH